MLLALFAIIFSIIALYLYKHHKLKSKDSTLPAAKMANKHKFHCVETHHHDRCCKAVEKLHGKRFLSAEAPMLPVNGCDQAQCHCDYIHHDDRRVEIRRNDTGLQHDMYGQNGEVDHRQKKGHGRRATD